MENYIKLRNEAIKLIRQDIGHRLLNEGPGGNPHASRRIQDLVQLDKCLTIIYGPVV
jgi:hypothetical protein